MQLQRLKSSMLAEVTEFKHKKGMIHISLTFFFSRKLNIQCISAKYKASFQE